MASHAVTPSKNSTEAWHCKQLRHCTTLSQGISELVIPLYACGNILNKNSKKQKAYHNFLNASISYSSFAVSRTFSFSGFKNVYMSALVVNNS